MEATWKTNLAALINQYTTATPDMLKDMPGYKYGFSLKNISAKETIKGIWHTTKTFFQRADYRNAVDWELSKNLAEIIDRIIKQETLGDLKITKAK